MPEGEKLWCYLLLPLVEIGLTDLPNIRGPPGYGINEPYKFTFHSTLISDEFEINHCLKWPLLILFYKVSNQSSENSLNVTLIRKIDLGL